MINNSNNINDIDKKKIRRNKKNLFEKERNNILQELINLINFDNNSILLVQLQDNIILKKYLNDNYNDIKKYYRCSSWGYFVSINYGEKGDEIALLKAIFKDHGYSIFSKDITSEYNNIKKRYTKLFFTK